MSKHSSGSNEYDWNVGCCSNGPSWKIVSMNKGCWADMKAAKAPKILKCQYEKVTPVPLDARLCNSNQA